MRSMSSAVTISTHFWEPHIGGVERVAARQARHLVSIGLSVEVHSSRIPSSAKPLTIEGPLTIHRHFALNPLEQWFNVPVPFPGRAAARSLSESASRSELVVAHGHTYPISLLAARAAKRHRRRFVLVQHSPWIEYAAVLNGVERMADRVVGRRVMAAADLIVCVSSHTERYMKSLMPDAPCVVVRNGVDNEIFSPLGPRIESSRPLFVAARRLVPRNGIEILLHAWALADLGSVADLVIIGDGPERDSLQRAATALSGVRFVGRVLDDELAAWFRSATATVVPSTTGEGFGLVAAESLASHTPVIASDQGGLREVIRHDVDGLLVAPSDPVSLAAALRRVTEDPSLAARLAAGAATTDWSWDRSLDEFAAALLSTSVGHQTRSEFEPVSAFVEGA